MEVVKQQHRMFWNGGRSTSNANSKGVKQQHRMFWNKSSSDVFTIASNVKQQHRMFWNTNIGVIQNLTKFC